MMFKYSCLLAVVWLVAATNVKVVADDWPWWRGPYFNGHASAEQDPPIELQKPAWEIEIAGRAHGSPIVVGDRVLLTAADPVAKTQSLLAIDRKTGKQLWAKVVHEGGFNQRLNKKATWASNSPACDGRLVFVNFLAGKSVYTTAFDLDGKQIWQSEIGNYKVHQGYGSSPLIYEDLVIVSADTKSGGALVGLHKESGKEAWRVKRSKEPNYPSPIIFNVDGKDQLFLTGTKKVSSFNPSNGEVYWEIDGATTECVTTTVTDGKRIFSSGGYPRNHVAAIAVDGSGKVAWENTSRVYVPSMLVKDGYLYAVMDAGVAVCWDCATGEEKWKGRLGGTFSGSPTLVGDRIYVGNESGTLYVYRADPEKFEILAKNEIAGEIYSTPAICNSEIFLRVADYQGETRTEKLVCYRQ